MAHAQKIQTPHLSPLSLFGEALVVWALVIFLCRLLVNFQFSFFSLSPSDFIPLVLIYTPFFVWWVRKSPAFDFLGTQRGFGFDLRIFLLFSLLIFPLAFVGNHFYQLLLHHAYHGSSGRPWVEVALTQIFLVALPEEFFFRGYLQGRLNDFFEKKFIWFQVPVGWSLILTSILFALSHSLIYFQWWHVFIFFPALGFGWLREKTGGLLAPLLFHGCCNIFSYWVFVHYSLPS